jgi:hypothetical protein
MNLSEDEQKQCAAILAKCDSADRQQIALSLAVSDAKEWRASWVRLAYEDDDGNPKALMFVTTDAEKIRRLDALLAQIEADEDAAEGGQP